MDLTLAWITDYSIIKCVVKLIIHSQTSTVLHPATRSTFLKNDLSSVVLSPPVIQ